MIELPATDPPGPERTRLNFADAVTRTFSFLTDLGFVQVEGSPTIVRYRNGDVEAVVYHGRRSYELGFEVQYGESKYSMWALIRASDPEAASQYRNFAARTQSALNECLTRLEGLVKRYGQQALRGDRDFFAQLQELGKLWKEEWVLDMLERQLRPEADEAFRQRNYREAAELYERIQPRLTPAEQKKLAIAKSRGQG